MLGHDGGTGLGIPGGFRIHTGDAADGHRLRRAGADLHLGDLGVTGHLPCLAERASRFVRCGLGHAARQHRAHGVGFLSALVAIGN